MRRSASVCVLSCVLCAVSTRVAVAQVSHPAMDAHGYLTLDGASTLEHGELSFGLGSLDWGHGVPGADNLVSATLVAALGLHLLHVPLELGASLPIAISNSGDNQSSQGLGDAGVHLKVHVAQVGHVGFGAIASVYFPTASAPELGAKGVTPELDGVVDLRAGRWRFAVNGGVRRISLAMDDAPVVQVPAGVAAAVALVPQKLELVAEVFTEDAIDHELQALGGFKAYLARNSYLVLGAGRGLAEDTSAHGTPDVRAMIGIVFEPKPEPIARAIAPNAPEAPDAAEAPPAVAKQEPDPPPPVIDDSPILPDPPEGCSHDGPKDSTDCPDRNAVVVGATEIVTLKSIEFEFDKAIIRPISYPILDNIARALHDNPDIQLVEVRGHTDERGSAPYNLDLSQRRADAVVRYLVDKGGIDADRLTSTGYGDTIPLDTHHNEAAWTKNRRVEFQIRKRNGELL